MAFKLHTANLPGNLHSAATIINKWGWAEYLLSMDFSGSTTVCVFRMPAEKVWQIREEDITYAADPHHDDYVGPDDPYSIDANSKILSSFVQEHLEQSQQPMTVNIPAVTEKPADTPPTQVPGATTKKRNGKKAAEKPAEPIQDGDIDESEQIHSPDTAGSTEEVSEEELPAWARV